MDIEKLIEQANRFGMELKRDGGEFEYSIGEKFLDYATALSTLQAENEKLRAELEQVVQKYETAVKLQVKMTEISNRQMAELEQVKAERDAAIDRIYKIGDALDRGNDNDWAREHISEWESQKED